MRRKSSGWVTARVDLTPLFKLERGGNLSILVDMLRFVGLLKGNIEGWPMSIEYETGEAVAMNEIARWASFDVTAAIVQ